MKKIFLRMLLLLCTVLFFVGLYFHPFETNKQCGELSLCWVKFGVYEYDYDSEVGKAYFGKDIQFYRKVGGFWEYVGLKEIDCHKQQ